MEKEILEEWDKIKDTLKRKDFEHFKEAYTAEFWYNGANVDVAKLDLN